MREPGADLEGAADPARAPIREISSVDGERNMTEARAFAMSVPADARYLKIIRRFFQPIVEDLFGEEAGLLLLALDEACSNVVKHRSKNLMGGKVHVRAEVSREKVRFRIGDFCGKDDIPNIKPRELDDVRPGGLDALHF